MSLTPQQVEKRLYDLSLYTDQQTEINEEFADLFHLLAARLIALESEVSALGEK